MTKSRSDMWAEFAGQALAGNLSRNAYSPVQVDLAARAADTMMAEFDQRFVFDRDMGCWTYRDPSNIPKTR